MNVLWLSEQMLGNSTWTRAINGVQRTAVWQDSLMEPAQTASQDKAQINIGMTDNKASTAVQCADPRCAAAHI
jgi:hypothetical protein